MLSNRLRRCPNPEAQKNVRDHHGIASIVGKLAGVPRSAIRASEVC
jgi:hypothetical protein